MGFNPEQHLKEEMRIGTDSIASWDVLRWKVFGLREGKTYSISDFTAISSLGFVGFDEITTSGSAKPSWFGSVDCDTKDGHFPDTIECAAMGGGGAYKDYDPEMESALVLGTCTNTQAREHYDYAMAENKKISSENIIECYEIGDFLPNHRLNYLTLTNMVNRAVFREDLNIEEKEAISKIYYRVELFSDEEGKGQTERNEAEIIANGYSGDSKQSVSVKIRKGQLMPVFNFSLYSTYKESHVVDGETLTGDEYFYTGKDLE